MDQIPEDRFLKYNTDTLNNIRRSYNLDKPGQMDEAIDILETWIQKQEHFVKKDFPRTYLERLIIMVKGSIERTKRQLEKICTYRTLLPHFFDKIDAKKDFVDISHFFVLSLMPKLTEDNRRIQLLKIKQNPELLQEAFLKMYAYAILVLEYIKSNDYNDGLVAVTDLRNCNITDFVLRINFTELQQFVKIALEGYGARVKRFVLISNSNAINVAIKIMRQVFPEKIRDRISVVQNLEELHDIIPKHLLPSDYGGDENPLKSLREEFQELLSSEENIQHLKIMSQARSNEALRTSSKISDDMLGLAGSFRNLSFD